MYNYEGVLIGWLVKLVICWLMFYNVVNNMVDELVIYDFIWLKKFVFKLVGLLDKIIFFMGDYVIVVLDFLKVYLVKVGVRVDKI